MTNFLQTWNVFSHLVALTQIIGGDTFALNIHTMNIISVHQNHILITIEIQSHNSQNIHFSEKNVSNKNEKF